MRRKRSSKILINHQIFSQYSLIIAFVYMFRILFEMVSNLPNEVDVQWQMTESIFVVFGILISIAFHNAYDLRLSLISISWTIWMLMNTVLALFVINTDIIQLVIKHVQESTQLSIFDIIKLFIDVLHFFNIPISLYFICAFLISSNSDKKTPTSRKKKIRQGKPIVKKQFEVTNVFIGDEMVYYV